MAFTSIFGRERRPRTSAASPRKRPGRTFATSLASLERRALLAALAPAVLTPTTSTTITFGGRPQAPYPRFANGPYSIGHATPASATTTLPAGSAPAFDPDGSDSSPLDSPDSSASGGPFMGPLPLPSTNKSGGYSATRPAGGPLAALIATHVAVAEADVSIDGVSTPELALANAGTNSVSVKLGFNGDTMTLDANQGIDAPQSVMFSDVNGDGLPDLVVANSGADNILVFPGIEGGLVGPEINGGLGFAVGTNPVSVTIGDTDGFNKSEIIVANKDSNSVSVLNGQGTGAGWTATLAGTIPVGASPVKTILVDPKHDGNLALIVCNSGSNDVSIYQADGAGSFTAANPTVVPVGINPVEMFYGRFNSDRDPGLITLNAGSDDLTEIDGLFSAQPTSRSVSSGGVVPDAGFTVAVGRGGPTDLVVANSDGRMALLRGGSDGLQLAGVITQSGVSTPTGMAATSWDEGGLDFLVAGAGQDAAQLLHFDLGAASGFLASTPGESSGLGGSDGELFAQLMPFGDSGLDLLAVFWAGSPEATIAGESNPREPSVTALYSPTEGQGEETTPTAEVAGDPANPGDPSAVAPEADASLWARFVLGVDLALESPGRPVEAIAARDAGDPIADRPVGDLARLERGAADPDAEVFDEALRELRLEAQPERPTSPEAPPLRFEPIRQPEQAEARSAEARPEAIPLVSSTLLLSARLIFQASPPRPPSFRGKAGRGIFGRLWGHEPARNGASRV